MGYKGIFAFFLFQLRNRLNISIFFYLEKVNVTPFTTEKKKGDFCECRNRYLWLTPPVGFNRFFLQYYDLYRDLFIKIKHMNEYGDLIVKS